MMPVKHFVNVNLFINLLNWEEQCCTAWVKLDEKVSQSVSQSSCIPLILNRVAGGAGADPSCHWVSGGVHPGQVASLSQGWDNCFHKIKFIHLIFNNGLFSKKGENVFYK